jgi:TolB-like protein/DNA-binding winged helix-turn-helix (wHTH) protein
MAMLKFENFTLDVASRVLRRGDTALELRPKSFDLLTCLALGAGRVLTKDELMAAVWPGLVVTDESLARCVSDIRHALGDGDQRLVKTIPRRGYQLAVTVDDQPAPSAIAPAPATGTAPDTALSRGMSNPAAKRHRPARLGATAILLLLVAVSSIAWVSWRPAGRESALFASSTPPFSVVVMPLTSIGGDPAQNYFAEGLAEELTTDLSRIPNSLVIARSSADSYKGRVVDAAQVGRDLGVRHLLEGSVARMGEGVQLNLRLVEAHSGKTLWADRIDGRRDDLVALQRQVTGTVARTLHLELAEAASKQVSQTGSGSPDAQDLALQAWLLYERRTPESVADARSLLQRAVSLDPLSAFAWSLLSDTYTADLLTRWLHLRNASREQWLQHAEDAANKAYGLDPDNLYAVGARATVLQLRGQPEQAVAMLRRQVELNRNYAPAWHRLSYAYVTLGRPADGLAAGNEAIRLSPRDGRLFSFYAVMAAACLHLERDAEALEWAKKSVAQRPQFATAHSWVASASALLGEVNAAQVALAEFRRLQPGYTIASFRAEKLSDNAVFLAQRERYYRGLRLAGLPD